jgi:hypothetical protein
MMNDESNFTASADKDLNIQRMEARGSEGATNEESVI